jgi:DNA polymerase III subunit chi
MSKKPEVLFYHLEHQPLERVLPQLIEKTLERGWKAVIQAGSDERAEAIDAVLWTYREDSFIPHAREGGAGLAASRQPILIATNAGNPNGSAVRFLVDGATLPSFDGLSYERLVILFNGADPDALTQARADWKRAKAAGLDATYWQQSQTGRWEKKA